MATPLRKVSQNFRLTMKRAQIATIVFPFHPDLESLNERNESVHANPIGVGFSSLSADIRLFIVQAKVEVKPPAEVENDYRSKSSFTPLPWEEIYPPGLYTVIAHNRPLRTRIQGHLDELEEFKAHVRRVQSLLSGWLVTLYHLMLIVVWNALVCAFLMSLGQSLQRHGRNLRRAVSSIFTSGTFVLRSHGYPV